MRKATAIAATTLALMGLASAALAEDGGWITCLSVNADGTQNGDIENSEVTATLDGGIATFTLADGTTIAVPMARAAVTVCEDGSVFTEDYTQAEIDEGLAEPQPEVEVEPTTPTPEPEIDEAMTVEPVLTVRIPECVQ